MTQITIEPYAVTTTKIGFGCSSLVGMVSPKEARALVDAAYDAGIRHFDVARSYGQGAAESLLGRALGSRRASVTVTSKFGLVVPQRRLAVDTARAILRPIAKRVRGVQFRSRAAGAEMVANVDFSRSSAELSLETTLRELGTDYVDIYLLHEATAETLTDPGLLEFLEESRTAGKIKAFGVGSQLQKVEGLITERPEYCPVIQHEWSPLSREVKIPSSIFRITHGSLARSFLSLRDAFRNDEHVAKSANAAVGIDVTVEENLAALVLRSAAMKYPDSITLFSARSTERIERNVRALCDSRLDGACRSFASFLSENRTRLENPGSR